MGRLLGNLKNMPATTLGGYAIVETKTKEEAEALANQFMELHRVHVPDFECECEVRPIEDY